MDPQFAGNTANASSKAAQLSAAAYSLGYASYGPYGNAPGFLDGLSRNNPAAWFNLSQTLYNIDPPGKPHCQLFRLGNIDIVYEIAELLSGKYKT